MLPVGYKFKVVSEAKLAQARIAADLGRVANTVLSLERRRKYNESPNYCKECKAPILVHAGATGSQFAWIKKKKFCGHSCGAKYQNRVLGYPHRVPKIRVCTSCGVKYTSPYKRTVRCSDCRHLPIVSILSSRKKSECRIQEVRLHARKELFKASDRKCKVCGYSIRVDCCHIKPIKEFPSNALLSEINAQSNLVALCPNHHVELDLGILILDRVVVP